MLCRNRCWMVAVGLLCACSTVFGEKAPQPGEKGVHVWPTLQGEGQVPLRPGGGGVAGFPSWEDDFESYANGQQLIGSGGWEGWDESPAAGASASNAQNHTAGGSLSVDVVAGTDLIHQYSGHTSGVWRYEAWQYPPCNLNAPNGAYFIIQKIYNHGGPYEWSVQTWITPGDQSVNCDCGGADVNSISYNCGEWNQIEVIGDFDNDWTHIYYNGELLAEYQWSAGVFGADGPCLDQGCIGSVDLFAFDSTSVYYDDMSLTEVNIKDEEWGACCLDDGAGCVNGFKADIGCDNDGDTFFVGEICSDITGFTCPNTVCADAMGDCFESNGTVGCDGNCGGAPCEVDLCCTKVCNADTFCCTFVWDGNCANEAMGICSIPENSTCDNAPIQEIPPGGGTIIFSGNNQGGADGPDDCDVLQDSEVWIAFEIPEKMNVELDYCDSPDFFDLAYVVLTGSCPCGDLIFGVGDDLLCLNGNPHRVWACLEAGTYYYPILSEFQSEGDYTIKITGTTDVQNCPDCPLTQCSAGDETCTLQQSFSNFNAGTQVACGAGADTTENGWARCFDLNDEGISGSLTIDSVQFGVGQFDGSAASIPININIYDSPSCPPSLNSATLVSTTQITITAADVGTYIDVAIDSPPTIAAGGSVVIEIEAPLDGTEAPNHAFRTMSNALGECEESYLRSSSCGIDDWVTSASIGFPDADTWMTASGTMGDVPVCGGSEILSASPEDGAVDARQPHPPGPGMDQDPALRQGIGSADEPIVLEIDAAGNAANCFELCETSADPILGANGIASVTEGPDGTYSIVLDWAIAPGAWTSISVGTVSVSYNSHPANVDAGQFSNASDVLTLIDILNGVTQPVWGDLSTDIDHSGVFGAADVLRVIDLLNGAIPYAVWNGMEAPVNTCP